MNKVDKVKNMGKIEEKLEEAGEVLEEAEQEVIDTLCEEYGVDEETIQNLLDDMGLSALDLLNPRALIHSPPLLATIISTKNKPELAETLAMLLARITIVLYPNT